MNNLYSHNMSLNDKIIMSKWFREEELTPTSLPTDKRIK